MSTLSAGTVSIGVKPDTSSFGKDLRAGIAMSAQDLIDSGRVIGDSTGRSLLSGITSHLSNAGQSLSNVGKSMSLAITAPLVAIGVQGVKSAADFGVTMASMQVNAGASGAQMEDLRKLALKMGADTVYSAGEAADAMLELSKGGLSIAAIQGGALASAMNLAATEGIGLADASTIVVQAMNTFHMSAQDSAKAVDILAAGAVASTASVQDLAAGLKYVGSTAAALHIPMSDTVTAMAALNNAGIDATTAGTSLNQFMLRLIPTTRQAAKEAQALGIDFVDTAGRVKPMNEVIKELQATYGTMGDAAKTASLKTIFGVEGMRAANILISGGVQGWNDLSTAVNKQGVAADMAGARMSGLAGSIEMMKGSIDTAMLAVGNRLDPTIRTLTGNITNLVNGFAALSPETQGMIVNFGMAAAVTGPLVFGLGKTFTAVSQTITGVQGMISVTQSAVGGLGNLVTGMTNASAGASAFATPMMKLGGLIREGALALVEWVAKAGAYIATQAVAMAGTIRDTALKIAHTAAIAAHSAATGIATAAQWLWNAALTANPIGIVIVAIGALVAGLIWFFTQTKVGQAVWKTFTEFMTSSMKAVGSFFAAAWQGIQSAFSTVISFLDTRFRAWGNSVIGIINTVIGAANAALSVVSAVTGGTINVKVPTIPKLAEGGIVPATPGGRLVRVAEAGQAEAVIPLSKLGSVGGGSGATINYYAARNDSISAEAKLVAAVQRAKVLGAI